MILRPMPNLKFNQARRKEREKIVGLFAIIEKPRDKRREGSKHYKMEKGAAEDAMQKNRLQEYTQKSGMPLPIYQVINEGFPHAPKFRCRVLVNGSSYISRMTYPLRKQAEQDAAQLALQDINQHRENEECTILPDLKYCKSILHEYSVKENLEGPKYTTTQAGRSRPIFVSTLVFNGKSYTGQIGKSKKEAERQAACITIKSLLESSSCVYLHQVIKSKIKISGKSHQTSRSTTDKTSFSVTVKSDNSSKQLIDTPQPSVNLSMEGPTVGSDHDNKRKLDSSDLGSKKAPRHSGSDMRWRLR